MYTAFSDKNVIKISINKRTNHLHIYIRLRCNHG
ncbi:hypothetical protein [Methylophaga sp.]